MEQVDFIKQKTGLPRSGIQATLQLIASDCTLPFIARYRKEQTGNLDEVALGSIIDASGQWTALDSRKRSVLKSLSEQGINDQDLQKKILDTDNLAEVEDLYLPYKRKKTTKAEKARQQGLEPLAKMIMSQNLHDLDPVVDRFIKGAISNHQSALEGAGFIIAEWLSERRDLRNKIRWYLSKSAQLQSKVIKSKSEEEDALKYKDYFDWSESLHRCPSHRFLAIMRAENEGFVRVKVIIDEEKVLRELEERIIKRSSAGETVIEDAIKDAYKRLLYPSLVTERLKEVRLQAELAAIKVFAKNLQQLLLGPPLGEKRILGVDPGFRTGCKIVCLDEQGNLLHNETVYPHAPRNESGLAIKKISSLVNAYKIQAIAIGNGTASRETEHLIQRIRWSQPVDVFVVSEAGASVYSASKLAREEFPEYDVTVRGAVSIGRRLADPLAELVKIDPKSIGVGQYQHDVDQKELKASLDRVVELCVNKVGVNLNTASASLLSYVSGIGERLAQNLVLYREEQGAFHSRQDLKKVPRLGDKVFEQSAGFLRIKSPENPLDDSAVHPESYAIVKRMARDLNVAIPELVGNKALLNQIKSSNYIDDKTGLPTINDILKELEKPGLDPRKKVKVFRFDESISSINDLRVGQELPGIITNITNFGCFVDIGIKENGLIHISKLGKGYVADVNEVVSLQQQIHVRVESVDLQRKRIQLSLIDSNS